MFVGEKFYCVSIMASKRILTTPEKTSKTVGKTKLNDFLIKALVDENFKSPTPVQRRMIENFDSEPRNLFVYAPCKTGKTSAILMVIINKLLEITSRRGPYAIIIYPTYDLAKNAFDLAQRFSKYCPRVKVDLVVKKRELKNKLDEIDILIGTPEKVYQLLKENQLKEARYLVIDEADSLLHEKMYNKFLMIKDCLSSTCNVILAYASKTKLIDSLIQDHRYSAEVIEIPLEKHEMSLIDQVYVVCSNMKEQVKILLEIKCCKHYAGQAVIVCENKEVMDDVVKMCKDINIHVLYKALTQIQRTQIMKQFESGHISVLMVTPSFLNLISFRFVSILVNFNQILDQTTFCLNLEVYKKRESLLKGKKSLIVNIIEKRWQQYLFEGSKVIDGKNIFNGSEVIHFEKFAPFCDKA